MPGKNKKRTIALIVAGGGGERFGGKVPKQYAALAGMPMLRRTVEHFLLHPAVGEVRVVIRKKDSALYEEAVQGLKLPPPVCGGKTRQESVHNGLRSVAGNPPEYVLIHDAARPFVTRDSINRVVEKLEGGAKAVVPVIPIADTIKEVAAGKAVRTLPRDRLARAQTPQGFRFSVIFEAHCNAKEQDFTDDAAVAEEAGIEVETVEGDLRNIKVTRPEDIKTETETCVGMGFDAHRFQGAETGRRTPENFVRLCGVNIPHHRSLDGHSDADVGLHALVDALLGAIGKGDIGRHFPPSDPRWKGADSARFVEHARKLLEEKRGWVSNVDITIICEMPKISMHRDAMQARIAELLGMAPGRVNVKATTTEGLGFTGRGEGIAVQAAVAVVLSYQA